MEWQNNNERDFPLTKRQFSFPEFFSIVDEHRRFIILIFASVLVLTTIFTLLEKPVYESKASILVENDVKNLNILSGTPFSISFRKSLLFNFTEILKSQNFAKLVFNSLDRELKEAVLDEKKLAKLVSIKVVRETDVINIKARAGNPKTATRLATAYAETFEKYIQEITREDVSKIKNFTQTQLGEVEKELLLKEAELEDFKKRNEIVDLDARAKELLGRTSNLKSLYEQSLAEYEGKAQKLATLKEWAMRDKDELSKSLLTTTSPLLASLQKTYQNLELEKTDLLLAEHSPTSEKIAAINRRQEDIKYQILEEAEKMKKEATLANPMTRLQDIDNEIFLNEIELTSTKAKMEKLKSLLKKHNSELMLLPQKERILAKLQRDVEVLRKIYSLLREKNEEAKINEAGRISQIRLIESELVGKKIKPNIPLNFLLGIILSTIFAFGGTFLIEQFTTTVKKISEIEKISSLPILATIPTFQKENHKKGKREIEKFFSYLLTHSNEEMHGNESFRMLRTAILYTPKWAWEGTENHFKDGGTLLITSPQANEGKSTVGINLSYVLAQSNYKTLLIDGDLRKPIIHNVFGIKRYPGLTDLVISSCTKNEAIYKTSYDNLYVLPAGTRPPSPADFFAAFDFDRLLCQLREEFSFILIDSPPALIAADVSVLSSKVDGIILILRLQRTEREAFIESIKLLHNGKSKLIGCVVNDYLPQKRYQAYYYYRSKYQYHK